MKNRYEAKSGQLVKPIKIFYSDHNCAYDIEEAGSLKIVCPMTGGPTQRSGFVMFIKRRAKALPVN
jgi:hypothetical protein